MQMLGEKAAQHRPHQACQEIDACKKDLIFAAVLRRHNIGNDGLRKRDQPAAAKPLQTAREDQCQHRRSERARNRTHHKNRNRRQHRHTTAMDIADLAIKRRHCGCGQKIEARHPRDRIKIAKLPRNRW